MTYTDLDGNPFPTFAPGGIYVASLNRGRVCYDHQGRKLKIIAQGEGSTTVRRAGQPRTIKGRTFTPPETLTIARSSVVYLTPGGAPKPAPPTPEDTDA